MTHRLPHGVPYATHQWVGELLWQARVTLMQAECLLANSAGKSASGVRKLVSITARVDRVRSALEERLFAEHASAGLKVYYPDHPQAQAWDSRQYPTSPMAGRRRRALDWHEHYHVAELLFQAGAMLWEVWELTLAAYGATASFNKTLETIVPSTAALRQVQSWCDTQLDSALQRSRLQWPPECDPGVYLDGEDHFTPWQQLYRPTTVAAVRSGEGHEDAHDPAT